nr:substrate-binding domain-containing protein [Salinicola tamaricis]
MNGCAARSSRPVTCPIRSPARWPPAAAAWWHCWCRRWPTRCSPRWCRPSPACWCRAATRCCWGWSAIPPAEEEGVVETVLSRRPDGIVLTGCHHSALTRQRLAASRVPLVEIWDMSDDPIDMLIGFSHHAVGRAVADHLLARGYRRLGVISADDTRAERRIDGLRERLAEAGQQALPLRRVGTPSSMPWGREMAAELLDHHALEAIVCSSDILALGVIAEAQSRGLAIPDDLAIMGFGDSSYAAASFPALSTVRIDGATIGRRAAEQLLERMARPQFERSGAVEDIGFSLVDRATT